MVFFLGCCLQLTNHGASQFSHNSLTSLRVLTARVIIIANFKFIVLIPYCGLFEGFDFPFSGKVQPGPEAGSAHQAAKLHIMHGRLTAMALLKKNNHKLVVLV